ncbi:hypothetical protein O4J56_10565 [Nocardiopsis sp. RSe5-2]|uniref:Lipoprotein n=1 Tax=Nocardiopsis endophytica TaxID=3018445 RepID=A0ABT4U2B7_9ACTN|nr:hypothetical protein [Nocardiopsis endophytica]MDA2811079.1 hypothetical protein [Nocardiopsis endophytica]
MKRLAAGAVAGVTALALSGCSESMEWEPGGGDGPAPSPSPIDADTDELQAAFEEQSGLVVPDNASDMEIEAQMLEGDRPEYTLRFVTTRGGAEVVCDADNFGVYAAQEAPGDEEREVFDYQESDEEIGDAVRCEGSNPKQPRVQRLVSVVFPEDGFKEGPDAPDGEDVAVVYAHSILWLRR